MACRTEWAGLMTAFQQGALTLQRMRNGGNQTVQHVTVANGGQAVIGQIEAGGRPRRGRLTKNG